MVRIEAMGKTKIASKSSPGAETRGVFSVILIGRLQRITGYVVESSWVLHVQLRRYKWALLGRRLHVLCIVMHAIRGVRYVYPPPLVLRMFRNYGHFSAYRLEMPLRTGHNFSVAMMPLNC